MKEKIIKKEVYLDFDDFGETNNRLDWLWMLKKEFPNFKVNLFTIPSDFQNFHFQNYIRSKRMSAWIQLCVHGMQHINNEEIEENILQDLPLAKFAKIYRAPFWQLSDVMYERLKKLNYKIMLHPNDSREGIKYNWNIKDSPPDLPILYGHGHIQDVCDNGLAQSFENIMKLPKDTIFKFL
jgi:hypothetical protein